MPRKQQTGTAHPNARTAASAAGQAGCCGLPDPGFGPIYHDGGLRLFCRVVNERFDEMAATTHPELRSFARAEREARG